MSAVPRARPVPDPPDGPDPRSARLRRTVVGAAILDGGRRVLAAQRASPPATYGRWEFPGGKVEPGEDDLHALVRECREELGVTVQALDRLGTDILLPGGAVLRVWTARLVEGVPRAREHLALRWLSRGELDDVPWLAPDLPLVDALRDLL